MESSSTFYDLDSESFRNTTDLTLLAHQQRLYIRYDTFASVYQFTQVNPSCPLVMFSGHGTALLFLHDVTSAQPLSVLCLQLAKLLILERMLEVVTRQKTSTLDRMRRLSRVFVAIVVLGNMVGCLLATTLMFFQLTRPRLTSHISFRHQNSRHAPRHSNQVGIAGNFAAGGYILSTLSQSAAAAVAFEAGP